jgi:hypothetical protein
VLGQPPSRFVVRIQPDLALPLAAPLCSLLGSAQLQTLTSSFSFWASSMTFWATCAGTSS